VSVFARRTRVPEEVCAQWLDFPDRAWVVTNLRLLHEAGLTPQAGHDLYTRVPTETRAHMGRLVDAGKMAGLDTAHLHWWAASGLLRAETTVPAAASSRRSRQARPVVNFTKWVTQALRYVAATGGEQGLAALAAGAGLSVAETASRAAEGTLDRDALTMLVALREQTHA
jgi:hypothetical protein